MEVCPGPEVYDILMQRNQNRENHSKRESRTHRWRVRKTMCINDSNFATLHKSAKVNLINVVLMSDGFVHRFRESTARRSKATTMAQFL